MGLQERRGELGGGNGEKRADMAEKESERKRQSHLVCLILGRIIGLQEENYCTSPRRVGATSLSTLINWESLIAQTSPLSVC